MKELYKQVWPEFMDYLYVQLYYVIAYTFCWVGASNVEIYCDQLGVGQYSYVLGCNQYALKCRSLFWTWSHQNRSYSESDNGWCRLPSLPNNYLIPHQPTCHPPLLHHVPSSALSLASDIDDRNTTFLSTNERAANFNLASTSNICHQKQPRTTRCQAISTRLVFLSGWWYVLPLVADAWKAMGLKEPAAMPQLVNLTHHIKTVENVTKQLGSSDCWWQAWA